MNNQIINDRIKQYVKDLRTSKSIVEKIRSFPEHFLKNNERLGRRTFYWCIRSINELEESTLIRYSVEDLKSIIEKFNSSIKYDKIYDKKTKEGLDPIWYISMIQAFVEIERIVNKKEKEQEIQMNPEEYKNAKKVFFDLTAYKEIVVKFDSFKNELRKEFKEIIDVLDENDYENELNYNEGDKQKEKTQNFYRGYWIYLIHLKSNFLDEESLQRFYLHSEKVLSENLSVYDIKIASSNQMLLAVASHVTCSNSGNNYKLQNQLKIKQAARIAFNKQRSFYNTIYLHDIQNEVMGLTSMEWEEMLAFCELDSEFFPSDISITTDIIGYMQQRIAKFKSEDGIFGLFDQNSPDFPDCAPYFTSYGIVLLCKLCKVIKERLKMDLLQNLRDINPEFVQDIEIQKKITNQKNNEEDEGKVEKEYDTVENTRYNIQKEIYSALANGNKKNLAKCNSILLFGPPGTGKTHLIKSIGSQIQTLMGSEWKYVTLAPSTFLIEDSYSEILNNIAYIFDALLLVDECIFFFDEAEELIKDRTQDDLRFGRMFTSAMLLFLNRMDKSNSFFIFATNYIDQMDSAAIRKGRFSIRKGLSVINDKSVNDFITKELDGLQTDVKFYLKKKLLYRPIPELIDIRDRIETLNRQISKITKEEVEQFFDEEWKKYLSDDIMLNHLGNCEKFDDHTTPVDFSSELRGFYGTLNK